MHAGERSPLTPRAPAASYHDGTAPFFLFKLPPPSPEQDAEASSPSPSGEVESKSSKASYSYNTRSHDAAKVILERDGVVAPSDGELLLYVCQLELVYFNNGVVADKLETSSDEYCTHTLVILRFRGGRPPATLSYQQHGLTYDVYKVDGSFGEATHPRFCSRLAEAGFPARSETLPHDVRLRDIWSSALGFTKIHKWCPGPATPTANSSNCAGFGNFMAEEIVRLARGRGSLSSSEDSEDDSDGGETRRRTIFKVESVSETEGKGRKKTTKGKQLKKEVAEEQDAGPSSLGFKLHNLGKVLATTDFGDAQKIWYKCAWAGPYSSNRNTTAPRPKFRKGDACFCQLYAQLPRPLPIAGDRVGAFHDDRPFRVVEVGVWKFGRSVAKHRREAIAWDGDAFFCLPVNELSHLPNKKGKPSLPADKRRVKFLTHLPDEWHGSLNRASKKPKNGKRKPSNTKRGSGQAKKKRKVVAQVVEEEEDDDDDDEEGEESSDESEEEGSKAPLHRRRQQQEPGLKQALKKIAELQRQVTAMKAEQDASAVPTNTVPVNYSQSGALAAAVRPSPSSLARWPALSGFSATPSFPQLVMSVEAMQQQRQLLTMQLAIEYQQACNQFN
jgi:hypothetical protein